MKATLTTLLLFAGLASGCIKPRVDDTQTARTPDFLPDRPDGPALRVLVLGDHGTGKKGQIGVAAEIAKTHGDAPPHLVLTVGDNFYPSGIDSVEDELWEEAFGGVYAGPFWDSLVFYPSLGNHDHEGSVEAQVEYSSRDSRWSMPDTYYTAEFPIPGGGVARFVAMDTYPITREMKGNDAQEAFLDSAFNAPGADWIIPYGHHPVLRVGLHGEDKDLLAVLLDRISTTTSFLISGHDHIVAIVDVPELVQVTCGGGAGRDKAHRLTPKQATEALYTNGGWCFLHITQESMAVELYNAIGTLRHRKILQPNGSRP